MWVIRHHPRPEQAVQWFRDRRCDILRRSVQDVIDTAGCPHALRRLGLWASAMHEKTWSRQDWQDIVKWAMPGKTRDLFTQWHAMIIDVLASHAWFADSWRRRGGRWCDALRWRDAPHATGQWVRQEEAKTIISLSESTMASSLTNVDASSVSTRAGLEDMALLPLEMVASDVATRKTLRLVSKAMMSRVDELGGSVCLGSTDIEAMYIMLQRRQRTLTSMVIVHPAGFWAMWQVLQQGGLVFQRLRRLVVDLGQAEISSVHTDMIMDVLQAVAPRLEEFTLYNAHVLIPALSVTPVAWPALVKWHVEMGEKSGKPTTAGGKARWRMVQHAFTEACRSWLCDMMLVHGTQLTHVMVDIDSAVMVDVWQALHDACAVHASQQEDAKVARQVQMRQLMCIASSTVNDTAVLEKLLPRLPLLHVLYLGNVQQRAEIRQVAAHCPRITFANTRRDKHFWCVLSFATRRRVAERP